MSFTQLIEFQTDRWDEVVQLMDTWDDGSTLPTGPTRVQYGKDRDKPNTYWVAADFTDYKTAMENSNNPETQSRAEQMMKLCTGQPRFVNIDIEGSNGN